MDQKRLNPKYFNYLTKTSLFIDFCIRASSGTTNRLYLQEAEFLKQQIPLPPIAEQRRIVVRRVVPHPHIAAIVETLA
ncbi:MAG: hypothetical protein HC879_15220 [Leptolyngbyaceae cyanobacterium SL_5_9]|nr:hypothetical protein [Leptolyngbyaceae cyanobacterium SL_5_9]NJO72809.1 hypothetical protein [Leptolyngbyaceae cyanobacterium RM1_406_9]